MRLNWIRVVFWVWIGVCFGGVGAFGAQTPLIFERGLSGFPGFEDTSIFHDVGDAAVNNAGGGIDGIFVGKTAQLGLRRGLVRIDLTSIPKGSRVVGVTLELTVDRSAGNAGNVDIELHRAAKGWGEGSVLGTGAGGDGGAAGNGDATWLANHFGISTWTNPGGDFDSTASAVAPAGRAGDVASWSGAGLVADVQSWVDAPETNFGWFVVGDEANAQRAKRFSSSEAASNRPRLVVTLAASAEPSDVNGDGLVDAVDIQLVINAALGLDIGGLPADVNGDTVIDAVDIQTVINTALGVA